MRAGLPAARDEGDRPCAGRPFGWVRFVRAHGSRLCGRFAAHVESSWKGRGESGDFLCGVVGVGVSVLGGGVVGMVRGSVSHHRGIAALLLARILSGSYQNPAGCEASPEASTGNTPVCSDHEFGNDLPERPAFADGQAMDGVRMGLGGAVPTPTRLSVDNHCSPSFDGSPLVGVGDEFIGRLPPTGEPKRLTTLTNHSKLLGPSPAHGAKRCNTTASTTYSKPSPTRNHAERI